MSTKSQRKRTAQKNRNKLLLDERVYEQLKGACALPGNHFSQSPSGRWETLKTRTRRLIARGWRRSVEKALKRIKSEMAQHGQD